MTTHFFSTLHQEIKQQVIGNEQEQRLLLTALLAEGHVLLEDDPGSGKTALSRALSESLGLRFQRVQATPDLLPSDLTGISVYRQDQNTFEFHPGPVFTEILLVDEINRATPRTQSALLEAMAERQVTVDGQSRALAETILELRKQVRDIYLHPVLLDYLVTLCEQIPSLEGVVTGVSHRCLIQFAKACQALAFLKERNFVLPDDIQELAVPVLAHRLFFQNTFTTSARKEELIRELLHKIPVPTENWEQ